MKGLLNFPKSHSDSAAAQVVTHRKERGAVPEHQLGVVQKLPCLSTRLPPQQRATWHRTAGGRRTEEDKRWTTVGRRCPRPRETSHPQFSPSLLVSIPAPFLLGVVVLGGITGMLLGFSQVLLRCNAGTHTAVALWPCLVVPHTLDSIWPGSSLAHGHDHVRVGQLSGVTQDLACLRWRAGVLKGRMSSYSC